MSGRGAYQKKNQNKENVLARHELLLSGIRAPLTIDNYVIQSLSGQRAFAFLNFPKLRISPISLNTIKSLANELFITSDGEGLSGFAYFDSLRVKLVKARADLEGTRTIEAKNKRIENKTENLEARLAATEAQSVKRQKAYLNLYSAVNNLVKNGGLAPEAQVRLYKILENHHATFADLFDPNITNVGNSESKISDLHGKHKSR